MQHPKLTPLMQIQATPRNTQSKLQPPKLRIPPRSQLTYIKQHNCTPTQQLMVGANRQQHTQYPPINKPMNTTRQSITQNMQSLIHNFILNQVHKHHESHNFLQQVTNLTITTKITYLNVLNQHTTITTIDF